MTAQHIAVGARVVRLPAPQKYFVAEGTEGTITRVIDDGSFEVRWDGLEAPVFCAASRCAPVERARPAARTAGQ